MYFLQRKEIQQLYSKIASCMHDPIRKGMICVIFIALFMLLRFTKNLEGFSLNVLSNNKLIKLTLKRARSPMGPCLVVFQSNVDFHLIPNFK